MFFRDAEKFGFRVSTVARNSIEATEIGIYAFDWLLPSVEIDAAPRDALLQEIRLRVEFPRDWMAALGELDVSWKDSEVRFLARQWGWREYVTLPRRVISGTCQFYRKRRI